jgi:hypothetical protein
MTLSEHVFLYCERGTSVLLLAEPWNAASNAGFILAGLIGIDLLLRKPVEQRSADQFLLAVLILLIGLGSLSFHAFANRVAELADVIPISIFMLVYLGFALNRFLGTPPGWTVLLVVGFAVIAGLAGQLKCWDGAIGIPGPDVTGAVPCLNGSVGYLPALFALIVIGVLMRERNHRAAPFVLWAAAIFALSITLRSADLSVCNDVAYEDHKIGTHFIWHLLNAGVLFLLFLATFRAGEAVAPASLRERLKQAELEKPASVIPDDAPVEAEPEGTPAEDKPTQEEEDEDGKGDDEKEEEGEKENAKDKEDESSSKNEPSN